jgi:hypothetical protein
VLLFVLSQLPQQHPGRAARQCLHGRRRAVVCPTVAPRFIHASSDEASISERRPVM